jgi:hypothetical protein
LVIVALTLPMAQNVYAGDVIIDVHADHLLHPVSRYLTGACLEDVNHEVYGGIYSQMIFGESFQEPAIAPPVKDFTSLGGAWHVRDGAIWVDGADGPKLLSDHAPFKDGTVGVELFFPDNKGQLAGILLRVNKAAVGADKFVGYEVSLNPVKQILSLARHRNNYEPIADVHCEVPIGQWIPLEVKLAGPVIEISVDGKMLLRHDDGEHTLPAGTIAPRPWHRQAGYRNLWLKTGEQLEHLPFVQTDAGREVSGMWRPISSGSAAGRYALVREQPFIGTQSQQIIFESGEGEIGIESQGLNRWGTNFVAGKPYEGYVWAKAQKPTTFYVALESRDGAHAYAEQSLNVAAGDWQRLNFALTPTQSDTAGRFAIKLKGAGEITIGHAFLQPGEWGRFRGLPVRRDVAEGLIAQGVTVLRYGGSMVNSPAYDWKKMIGPRDRRPPYAGTWYHYSSNGWGIPDFMQFCEAAGFEYIPAFNIDQKPADMAAFIDYAKADPGSEWGKKRAADGHAAAYHLRMMELGNEERVDETYAAKFEALASAIWAKDPKMILVVGDFAYTQPIADPFHFAGADSRITSLIAHQRILKFAKQHDGEVWFDVHVNTDHPEPVNRTLDGMRSFDDALAKIADGAKFKVVVFEFNSGNHAQKRALANAQAINVIERDGRVPIVCVANCLQCDHQNDNGWDQGLLFLDPSHVWLQPPGYLTQMLSTSYQPQLVQCDVTGGAAKLDANAKTDGKTLVLQVVNSEEKAAGAQLHVGGFVAGKDVAKVLVLAGPLEAANAASGPAAIAPKQIEWKHELKNGNAAYVFPAHSITVITFE